MREYFGGELDSVQSVIGEWFHDWSYSMQPSDTQGKLYRKILVPLERSIKGTGPILDVVQNILKPDGEAILLHVIPSAGTKNVGSGWIPGSLVEKHERSKAMGFLKYFADRQNEGHGHWRCEVAVSASVANGIAGFASLEEVELIAMYSHGRTGIAKLIKGSIAEKVQQCATTQVRVLTPRTLVPM